MDEEADAGHHTHHGQGQTVQAKRKTRREIRDLKPTPQWLGKYPARGRTRAELDGQRKGHQRRHTDRTDADDRRGILGQALAAEAEDHESEQRCEADDEESIEHGYPFISAAASMSSVRKRRCNCSTIARPTLASAAARVRIRMNMT